MLEDIFISEREKLGRKFNVELVKLKGQTFYTDTEKFSKAIHTIFKQFNDDGRERYPNIIVKVDGDSTDEFIELKITQINSASGCSAKVMLEEIKDGHFTGIKENLTNLCDWSIESSHDGVNYKVNYLKSNNTKDIEDNLEYKPEGFTHVLRFYNK